MGIFDGIGKKLDRISKQIYGSLKQANETEADRGKFCTVLGSEVTQEALLK